MDQKNKSNVVLISNGTLYEHERNKPLANQHVALVRLAL